MLHALPITNVRLSPCQEEWAQMAPAPGGRHCQSCQRVVIDFRHATEPELAWARLAAPDGRVCGQFRTDQLARASRPPRWQLRPRLRLFLLAAVLVLLQGLSARQAWAQARYPRAAVVPPPPPPPGGIMPPPPRTAKYQRFEGRPLYQFVDQMPTYKHGGLEGLQRDLAAQVQWPQGLIDAEGNVFVRFVVDRAGRIRTPRVVKGIHPTADAQALRAVSGLSGFAPGRQQGQAVDVEYTVPVKFAMHPAKARRQNN